jgi:hypothetical protein
MSRQPENPGDPSGPGRHHRHRVARRFVLVGVPLAFAALLLFHPIPMPGPIADGINDRLLRWNLVHLAQLLFIGAVGYTLWTLVDGTSVTARRVTRIATVLFVCLYGAYEAWTGIGTGLMTLGASDLDPIARAAAVESIQVHWQSPLLGNLSVGAIAGSTAWLTATVAGAIALRTVRASAPVVITLALSGLVFAPTHVPPFGPIAMALVAFAGYRLDAGQGLRTAGRRLQA